MKNVNTMKQMMRKGLLMLVITASAFTLVNAQTNTPMQRTISASGNAKIEVVPDEIYVAVNLREYDKKGAGKVDIESIKNSFLKACKSIGLSDTDVVVQSYSGYDGTIYQYKKNKKQDPDLKAGINYLVQVSSLKKMDELVSKLDDEATQNFNIAKTDYSKREELELKMKQDAIRAARDKAIALASAINEKIGQTITITEPNEISDAPRPMYMLARAKSADMAGDEEPALDVNFKRLRLNTKPTLSSPCSNLIIYQFANSDELIFIAVSFKNPSLIYTCNGNVQLTTYHS